MDFLMQTGRWEVIRRAISDQFSRGGSMIAFVAVIAVLAMVVIAVNILQRRVQANRGNDVPHDARKLFIDLMKRLGLSDDHRRLLGQVASDLNLEHPTTLLICPALFDRHVEAWIHRPRFGKAPSGERLSAELSGVRRRLFERS